MGNLAKKTKNIILCTHYLNFFSVFLSNRCRIYVNVKEGGFLTIKFLYLWLSAFSVRQSFGLTSIQQLNPPKTSAGIWTCSQQNSLHNKFNLQTWHPRNLGNAVIQHSYITAYTTQLCGHLYTGNDQIRLWSCKAAPFLFVSARDKTPVFPGQKKNSIWLFNFVLCFEICTILEQDQPLAHSC